MIQSMTGNYESLFLLKLCFETLLDSEFTEEIFSNAKKVPNVMQIIR